VTDCTDCPAPGRRQFLREVTAAVAGIMAALSASPRDACALPLSLGSALGTAGDELTYPVPAADGATIDRDNEVILVRWKGEVFAFALSCPHQNTALKWQDADSRFQCPKHKSRYQPDGTFISGRATRNMDRFAIRKNGKSLVVNVAKLYRNDKQATDWGAAKVGA
jgi:nitrite reductase/ring-hydroxylating ferredoxin subunit